MSDEFEITYGFNPLDASDALFDSDLDGAINVKEAQDNNNPLVDDYPPVIEVPKSLHLDADHIFTTLTEEALVAATNVIANDGLDGDDCCSLSPIGFERGVQVFTFWSISHYLASG